MEKEVEKKSTYLNILRLSQGKLGGEKKGRRQRGIV